MVDAFDGFEGNPEEEQKKMGFTLRADLGQGHKGCCITLLREWSRMIQDNVPYRVFFEDDALGHLDLPNGLGQTFWDATPKSFDILYLGSMMDRNHPEVADRTKLVVKAPTYCTHAYILSRKGAEKLLALAKQTNAAGHPLTAIDIQLFQWQVAGLIDWYCWNGTWTQKSFPTFDEGLPWQAFPDVILPHKDTGLFWQNMRVGTTLDHPTLQLTIPQYNM